MLKKLKQRNEGFTIIEVLIVLAIGGLIMLIVFLAVPALQRNQRNNARNNDGTRIAAAVTECLSNRNKQVNSCNGSNAAAVANVQVGTLSQLTSVTYNTSVGTSTSAANVWFNSTCSADGSTANSGGGATVFTVTYMLEGNVQRCISS